MDLRERRLRSGCCGAEQLFGLCQGMTISQLRVWGGLGSRGRRTLYPIFSALTARRGDPSY